MKKRDYFIKSLNKNRHLRNFSRPSWMKSLDEPDSPFDTTPPSYRESSKIIHKMKSSGSASPFDHISVIASKRCPIQRSAVHRIIVYCWTKNVTPVIWREGSCVLIYKKGTPKEPSNFTSITLEAVCKSFYFAYSKSNVVASFEITVTLKQTFRKVFGRGSLAQSNAETLTYMINHARRYQRNLVMTLLDLKNAFGELDHNLITSVLHYHHVPDNIRSLIGSFYTNYAISVGTNDFITNSINVEKVFYKEIVSVRSFLICVLILWLELLRIRRSSSWDTTTPVL